MGLGPGRSLTLGPYLSCSSWQTFLSGVEKAGTGVALGGVGGPCPFSWAPSMGREDTHIYCRTHWPVQVEPAALEAVRKKGEASGLLSSSVPSPLCSPCPRPSPSPCSALCYVVVLLAPLLSVAIFVMSSPGPISPPFCKWLLGGGVPSSTQSISPSHPRTF